jgi:hypothetical protein
MENDMSDIANAIYRHLRTMAPHQLERLTAIQLKEAADEIARLRLTDAEREAIKRAIDSQQDRAAEMHSRSWNAAAIDEDCDTLRGMLGRLG